MVANESANVSFEVDGIEYNEAYLLVDNIYLALSIFIYTIHAQQLEKLRHFAKCQEGAKR